MRPDRGGGDRRRPDRPGCEPRARVHRARPPLLLDQGGAARAGAHPLVPARGRRALRRRADRTRRPPIAWRARSASRCQSRGSRRGSGSSGWSCGCGRCAIRSSGPSRPALRPLSQLAPGRDPGGRHDGRVRRRRRGRSGRPRDGTARRTRTTRPARTTRAWTSRGPGEGLPSCSLGARLSWATIGATEATSLGIMTSRLHAPPDPRGRGRRGARGLRPLRLHRLAPGRDRRRRRDREAEDRRRPPDLQLGAVHGPGAQEGVRREATTSRSTRSTSTTSRRWS